MKGIESRIKKLEAKTKTDYADVCEWIKSGRFYDELSEDERQRYCDYRGSDKGAMETVNKSLFDGLHFPLEYKPRPATPEEWRQIVSEVEQYFYEAQKEYMEGEGEERWETQ